MIVGEKHIHMYEYVFKEQTFTPQCGLLI